MQLLYSDKKDSPCDPRGHQRCCGGETIDKPRTRSIEIERTRIDRTETLLQHTCITWTTDLRRHCRHNDEVEVGGLQTSSGERMSRCNLGHIGCLYMTDAAFRNARAFTYPLVIGIDKCAEVSICQRQRRSAFPPPCDYCPHVSPSCSAAQRGSVGKY